MNCFDQNCQQYRFNKRGIHTVKDESFPGPVHFLHHDTRLVTHKELATAMTIVTTEMVIVHVISLLLMFSLQFYITEGMIYWNIF